MDTTIKNILDKSISSIEVKPADTNNINTIKNEIIKSTQTGLIDKSINLKAAKY